MTQQDRPDASMLERSIGRVRICVLVSIALCAAVILSQDGLQQPPADPKLTFAAIALALGSIVTRRLAAISATGPRKAILLSLGSLLLALCLGLLGVGIAVAQDGRDTGILLALGGFILAMPRPHIASLPASPGR